MPIDDSDLEYRLSGGVNNEDPDASLGGAMSTKPAAVIPPEELENIFDTVTGDEGAAGDVEYRGVYIKNDHATLTLIGAKVWIEQDADSPDDATAIALADEAVNSAMETIANESAAPSGPAFSAPANKAAGLTIGDIPAGQYKGIWIRRTITAAADAKNGVKFVVAVEGDTGA